MKIRFGWLVRLLAHLKRTPVQAKPERTYSIAGWVRGADGVYRNGGVSIHHCGRTWVRDDEDGEYPTLHAAIEQKQPVDPAALFPQIERDLEQ